MKCISLPLVDKSRISSFTLSVFVIYVYCPLVPRWNFHETQILSCHLRRVSIDFDSVMRHNVALIAGLIILTGISKNFHRSH
jgi:hypothetical protein